jgi:hypothetical protein
MRHAPLQPRDGMSEYTYRMNFPHVTIARGQPANVPEKQTRKASFLRTQSSCISSRAKHSNSHTCGAINAALE